MFKLHTRVRLVKATHRPDLLGVEATIVGIWYTEPVWYHIRFDGEEHNFRATADQLEVVE